MIHISFTTALGELLDKPARKQTARAVLAALKSDGRLSVFDATGSAKVARTLDRLEHRGAYRTDKLGFPWLAVHLTDVGEAMLNGAAE